MIPYMSERTLHCWVGIVVGGLCEVYVSGRGRNRYIGRLVTARSLTGDLRTSSCALVAEKQEGSMADDAYVCGMVLSATRHEGRSTAAAEG